jgi:glycine C-acetyltransferase/8-amino-7-oxononanoate synthase
VKKTSLQGPVGATTLINGKVYDYFGGCGYLGLQNHPSILQAAADAALKYGVSTATSRGGLGESPVYDDLEKQACAFFDCEKVLYFASGYLGAGILIQSDPHPRDHFFIDADAHFSLWDAAAMNNCIITPFPHCSPSGLAQALQEDLQLGERPILLTDGLFPISGEIAPLADYLELIRPLRGHIILDDAHAAGVLGAHGRGTLEYFGLTGESCRVSATFNKALGGFGGIVYGKKRLLENIERNSRILAGSSPPLLPAAAASAKALQVLMASPELLEQLRANVRQARVGVNALGWDLSSDSPAPILCLPGRNGVNLFSLRDRLFEQGIAVEFVNSYPSAPAGGALRLAIFATHTYEQIERLLNQMRNLLLGYPGGASG